MILNFSVKNFGSIKNKQTLSFEADDSKHLEDTYVVNLAGKRVLKLALIYGANASGKTTILKALNFLRSLTLKPESMKNDLLEFHPFLFDPKTPHQNTLISIEFICGQRIYDYSVELTQVAIVSENLSYTEGEVKTEVYHRTTDLENQFTHIHFKKSRNDTQILEANTLANNTVLGGYLKTNIEQKELQDCIDWFQNYLNPMIYPKADLFSLISSEIDKKNISKYDVLEILKKADFNISDIVLRKKEHDVPYDFIDYLKNKPNYSEENFQDLDGKRKYVTIDVGFEHTVNEVKYRLPIQEESQGTRRYYGFAGLLSLLIKKSKAFLVDELEASLHPDLYLHFLILFILNCRQSQIVATTHNRELLENKDIFRNDAIWFTDKEEDCATELYSLFDFHDSVVNEKTNILEAYKSGKLSASPHLKDTFVDLTPWQE